MPLYHLEPTPKRALRAIVAYFRGIDKSTLAACLARYKRLGIWGQDYQMPEAGYERLVRSLLPGGFVPSGAPFTIAETALPMRSCTPTLRRGYVASFSLRMRTLRAPIYEQSRGAMAMETVESVL